MNAKALKDSLAAHAKIVEEIQLLRSRQASTASLLASKESACDLVNSKQLADIAELRTVADLLPKRIEQREAALASAEAQVLSTAHDFIQRDLSRRKSAIETRTRARVTNQLRPHFADEIALREAVEKSVAVQEVVGSLWVTINLSPDDVIAYAQRLLEVEARVAELEQSFGPEAVAA